MGKSASGWGGGISFALWLAGAAHAFIKAWFHSTKDDKFKHCYATCLISTNCGKWTAVGTGTAKEVADLLTAQVENWWGSISDAQLGRVIADSLKDLEADLACLNEGSSKDCECCCNIKIKRLFHS